MYEITIFTISEEDDDTFVDLDLILEKFEEVYEDYGSPEDDAFINIVEEILNSVADHFDIFYTDVGGLTYIFHPVYFSEGDIIEAWSQNDKKIDS